MTADPRHLGHARPTPWTTGRESVQPPVGPMDVLIVEDHPDTIELLHEVLSAYPLTVHSASDLAGALEQAKRAPPAMVLVDYLLPDSNGLEVLDHILRDHPQALVILMSAYSTIQMAVEAIRRGALDVLNKPFQLDQLEVVIQRALRIAQILAESRATYFDLRERFHSPSLVGQSPLFVWALDLASQVAATEATVLITGASGTGKELFARAIHANSRRAQKAFFPLNCSAIPDTLLESELFGYRRGAFTGADEDRPGILEKASGGTVFLDEIAETSAAFQSKLLRFLQNHEFLPLGASSLSHCDVRILAATNKPLEEWVDQRRFRDDLYFRINGFEIHLPPLRDRIEDIPILSESFIEEITKAQGLKPKRLSEEALRALQGHPWPGNVRELRNKIEQACILCRGDLIGPRDLFPRRIQPAQASSDKLPFPFPDAGLSWEALELALLKAALEKAMGNASQAARLVGMTRATFRYRCKRHGLTL